MAKKREFAVDSDVSMFISRKPKEYVKYTIYPEAEVLEDVIILSKINDVNPSKMFLKLIGEALEKENYRKGIEAYKAMKAAL